MGSVRLVGLTKLFPGGAGLRPTDLQVDAGGRLTLLGPTGSGKSTLLRVIAGLERPTAGEVWVGGERVDGRPPHRRGVSLLPQRVALYPHLTVAGNLQVATEASGRCKPADSARVADSPDGRAPTPAGSAGVSRPLASLMDRFPHQLSGGQRQLVGLAKLVAQSRPVWLLDEPFSGLDAPVRDEFRHDLHLLAAAAGATIVLVTHDPADAVALGGQIGILGGGVLKSVGTADGLRLRPPDRFAANCLAGLSLLDGRLSPPAGGDGAPRRFTAAGGAATGPAPGGSPDNLTLGIRPADLQAVPPGTTRPDWVTLTGWPVVSAEPVGSGWHLTLLRAESRVRAWVPAGSPPPVGTVTDWQLPPDRCHWFHADTGDRLGE